MDTIKIYSTYVNKLSLYTHIYAHIHMCIYTHIYVHVHMCIHTHIHTNTYTNM